MHSSESLKFALDVYGNILMLLMKVGCWCACYHILCYYFNYIWGFLPAHRWFRPSTSTSVM